MNCDEAFERLTDPACRESAELQWHLERCPRCRQMQDVLAPALDLFDSPVGEFAKSPPVSASGSAFLSAESILLAERTAADLLRNRAQQTAPRRPWVKTALRYAAVFLLGAALVFGVTTWETNRDPAGTASSTTCLWTEHKRPETKEGTTNAKNVVLSCVECHLSSSAP